VITEGHIFGFGCSCMLAKEMRATASKNSIFDDFAPSVVRRNWRSNVREWSIPTVNLWKVVSLFFLRIIDNNLV
jgi:hypothetical protein